ncbi:MAG: thioredoxin family protein [Candidatus Aenigmatarchaeota archaeon]
MAMKKLVAVLFVAVLVAGCTAQPSPTGAAVMDGQILEFYGAECPHCQKMVPVVAQVEQELGITITKMEVWHDEDNRAKFMEYADIVSPACGGGMGVPAFVNTKTRKAVCGEMTADQLKAFVAG